MEHFLKATWVATGGAIGWLVGVLRPTFPLIVVAVAFILYDAWTAYQLDKRVKVKYPDKTARHEAKFTSFAFGKVIRKTIPERLILIILAWMAETYVFIHVSLPLSYFITGAVLFEQAWSALENNSSCRSEEDSRFWKTLQKIMVDKTERHFDVNLCGYNEENPTEEQIEIMRNRVREWDKVRRREKVLEKKRTKES